MSLVPGHSARFWPPGLPGCVGCVRALRRRERTIRWRDGCTCSGRREPRPVPSQAVWTPLVGITAGRTLLLFLTGPRSPAPTGRETGLGTEDCIGSASLRYSRAVCPCRPLRGSGNTGARTHREGAGDSWPLNGACRWRIRSVLHPTRLETRTKESSMCASR